MNRKTQVIVATAVWLVCLLAVAATARMKGGLPRVAFLDAGQAVAGEPAQEESAEPPVAPPQGRESAATPPPSPPAPTVTPGPPDVPPPVAESAVSPVPPPPLDATVARSAPSADLLPPVASTTAEPPVLETTSAKPPAREDNVGRGEPMQPAPPRPLAESALALCLWSSIGGKAKLRQRATNGKNAGPFVGTFFAKLDDHKGLVLPQKASEQMGLPRHVYVTPGPEDCFWLCGAAALERLTATLDADARRMYFAQTSRVAVDHGGRIALPESAGPVGCLRQDVVLIGVGDHFELWDAQRLQRYVDQKAARK